MDFYIRAKNASKELTKLKINEINEALKACAKALLDSKEEILQANAKDIEIAKNDGTKSSLIDRLMLNHERLEAMANSMLKIAALASPLGEYIETKELENGLKIAKKRVPMGVIAIIYEARPNVTSDAFAMCFKAGSVALLKGSKTAFNSNLAIVNCFKNCLIKLGLNPDFLSFLEDCSKEATLKLMRMNEFVDLLIPRGGAQLIKNVIEHSSVPVIQTGVGNCHIFVDESANLDKAVKIIKNAKTQRVSVCNALETLLIHSKITDFLMPKLLEELKDVRLLVCPKIKQSYPDLELASEQDFENEFLDYTLAIREVSDLEEALSHIEKYSSKHSDAILTQDYSRANEFCERVDSAVVYVNASTRFSDGEQFGFGAEIGISTQKLHARGPMGLREITSYKYIVLGDGQIRE